MPMNGLSRRMKNVGARKRDRDTRGPEDVIGEPREDPPCPPGFTVGPPDFVGVGTQRSGTTWWFQQLTRHPETYVPEGHPKELHYFDAYWAKNFDAADVAAYHRQFPRPQGSIAGEWTPRYIYDFWVPPLLQRAAPDARFLVMLRDPVARLRSGIARGLRLTRWRYGSTFLDDAFERSRYHAQLSNFCAVFPRERVLVLQFERCVAAPEAEYRRTLEFLGYRDTSFVPDDIAVPVRKDGRRDTPIPDHVLDAAAARLRDDTLRLAADFDIDLALWPNFADLAERT
jgi:Sulfotransferase family